MHEGQNNYKCNLCDKPFSIQSILNFHFKSGHERLKNSKCILLKKLLVKQDISKHTSSVCIKDKQITNVTYVTSDPGNLKMVHVGLNITNVTYVTKLLPKITISRNKLKLFMKD